MCIPIPDRTMLDWLRNQSSVMAAWNDELLRRGETDLAAVERLERHQAWLTTEIARLEAGTELAA